MASQAVEKDSLKDELGHILEESRMVIPGVQALFGFQTMAVFNNRFEDLSTAGVTAYLVGLAMLAIAIALLMAPAAFHRMSERGQVSRELIDLSSRLLTWGMAPLAIGLGLDIYVVLLAALDDERIATAGGIAAVALFGVLWFVLPGARRRPGTRDSTRLRGQ